MRFRIAGFLLCTLFAFPALALAQQTTTEPTSQEVHVKPAETAAPTTTEDANASADEVIESVGNTTQQATRESSTGAASASRGKVGTPAADKAQVVFFRPSKLMGAAIGFKVREGSTELGKLRSGKYFIASVDPGTHEYTVHSEAKDVLTLEVDAGETYYVQASITMGFMAGRPNLSPSDQAAFDSVAAKLDLAK